MIRYILESLQKNGEKLVNKDNGTIELTKSTDYDSSRIGGEQRTFYNKETGARFFVYSTDDESGKPIYKINKVVKLPSFSKNSILRLGLKFIGKSTDPDIEEKIQKASETKE